MNEYKKEAIEELKLESKKRLEQAEEKLRQDKVMLEKLEIKYRLCDLYVDEGILEVYEQFVKNTKKSIEGLYNDIAKENAIFDSLERMLIYK
ncbi:MAG: hypothetical protein RR782_02600 [Clostridium sp.]